MATKIQPKSKNNTIYYKTKYLECEICKHPYPLKIKVNDKYIISSNNFKIDFNFY